MSLVAAVDARPFVATPIDDAPLQTIIDRIEADLTAVLGAPSDGSTVSVTEVHAGGYEDIYLKRPIVSVTSVTEYASLTDTTGTALTENESYYVWEAQGRLQRIGANWAATASVTYKPVSDWDKRTQAVIDLLRIYLAQSPLKAETVGREYSYQSPDNWDEEIRRVVRRLQFVII